MDESSYEYWTNVESAVNNAYLIFCHQFHVKTIDVKLSMWNNWTLPEIQYWTIWSLIPHLFLFRPLLIIPFFLPPSPFNYRLCLIFFWRLSFLIFLFLWQMPSSRFRPIPISPSISAASQLQVSAPLLLLFPPYHIPHTTRSAPNPLLENTPGSSHSSNQQLEMTEIIHSGEILLHSKSVDPPNFDYNLSSSNVFFSVIGAYYSFFVNLCCKWGGCRSGSTRSGVESQSI